MAALRSTPHVVTVTTPSASRDVKHNVTTKNYNTGGPGPATARAVKGLFQVRQGRRFISDTGEAYVYDAVFYTFDQAIAIDDMITLSATFDSYPSENFLVLSSEGKFLTRGRFSHTECRLVREVRR